MSMGQSTNHMDRNNCCCYAIR